MSKSKNTKTSEPSSEVLSRVLKVAEKFRTAKDAVEKDKDVILKLRAEFQVKMGSAGRKLTIEGNLITWAEFVDKYFHIGTKWMDILLGVKQKSKGTSEEKPDNEKPLYKKGFSAGRESLANKAKVEAEIKEGVNKKYEREIADLKQASKREVADLKRIADARVNHRQMLVKLLDEIEKMGDKVPVALTQLAKKMQAELEKKPVVRDMEKTLEEADVDSIKAKIETEDNRSGYKIARLEGSDTEFGLFPENSSASYTNAKALATGTKAKMEAERRERCATKKPEQSQAARAGN